jgi:hypothetical protein
MKKVFLAISFLFTLLSANSQMNPVTWTFTAIRKNDKMYEVQLKATIQARWHLYSQKQPDDAIAQPTSIKFNANPLFSLEGKIDEDGKMEKFSDKTLGISANQYSDFVVFIQKIKLKAKAKTNITGTVEFQTCDDKKCLPPKTIPFSIAIR